MNVKDIGKKIQNPELLEAMEAVKAKETDYRVARLFEMLAKAVLITPAKFDKEPQPDENGKVVIDSNIKVNFSLLTNQSGEKVLPCFTDEEILILMKNAADTAFAGEEVKEKLHRKLYIGR